MKKKFLKVALFSLVVSMPVSFVGCKDYDDDITEISDKNDQLQEEFNNKLEQQATALGAKVDELKAAQTELQNEAKRANEAASAAAKAAADAKKAGDDALAAAMTANAQAEAATAAVATAKAEALAETTKQVEALKASIESQIDALKAEYGKNYDALTAAIADCVKKTDFEKAIAGCATPADIEKAIADCVKSSDFNKAVSELEAKIGKMNNLSQSDVNAIIKSYLGNIGINETTISGINGQIAAISGDIAAITTSVGGNTAAIATLVDEVIPGIKDDIAGLDQKVNSHISAFSEYQAQIDLQMNALEEFKSKYETLLNGLDGKLTDINSSISSITGDLETLKGIVDGLTGVDDQTGIINGIKGDISEMDSKIQTIKSDLSKVQTDIKNINANLNALNAINAKRLTSVTLIPTAYRDGIPTIDFLTAQFSPMKLDEKTGLYAADSKAKPVIINSEDAKVLYRMNPAGVSLEDIKAAEVSFVQQIATSRASANEPVIKVISVEKNAEGQLVVSATKNVENQYIDNAGASNKIYTVALRVPIAEKNYYKWTVGEGDEAKQVTEDAADAVVYSEYARISDTQFAPSIAQNNAQLSPLYTWTDAQSEEPLIEIPYNEDTDLSTIATGVMSYNGKSFAMNADEMKQFGFSIDYSVIKEYKVNGIDQQLYATVKDGILTPVTPDKGKDLDRIGKTPVVEAVMKDAKGNVVMQKFFKVELVIKGAKDAFTFPLVNEDLNCEVTTAFVTWKQIEEQVIANLGFPMNKADFIASYTATAPADVTVDYTADDKTAHPIVWTIGLAEKSVAASTGNKLSKEIKFTNAAGLYPTIKITLTGEIAMPSALPELGSTVPSIWNNGVMRVLPMAMPTNYKAGDPTAEYNTNILQGRLAPYMNNVLECANWDIQFSKEMTDDHFRGAVAEGEEGAYNYVGRDVRGTAARIWYGAANHTYMGLESADLEDTELAANFYIFPDEAGVALVNSGTTIDLEWTVALIGKTYDNIVNAKGTTKLQIIKPLQSVTPADQPAITQNATEQNVDLAKDLIVTDVFGNNFKAGSNFWSYYDIQSVVWGGEMSITDEGKTYQLSDFKFVINVTEDGKLTYDGGGVALNHAVTLNVPVVVNHKWGVLESSVNVTIQPKAGV